ncbi:hypothetical protein [Streptomyces sp. NPDC050535]|uniref:hypothetical protein n=1 Tax=Streptomyces sp. NPDC050535 TaxID=3365626 RepID=UPI0037A9187A
MSELTTSHAGADLSDDTDVVSLLTRRHHEFPHIRRGTDRARPAAMARAAEAMAPTRPHPGTESGAANTALGPVAALVDRTRDAVRRATGKDGNKGF